MCGGWKNCIPSCIKWYCLPGPLTQRTQIEIITSSSPHHTNAPNVIICTSTSFSSSSTFLFTFCTWRGYWIYSFATHWQGELLELGTHQLNTELDTQHSNLRYASSVIPTASFCCWSCSDWLLLALLLLEWCPVRFPWALVPGSRRRSSPTPGVVYTVRHEEAAATLCTTCWQSS